MNTDFVRPAVATVPTVYGIETRYNPRRLRRVLSVATVPTVYGIETFGSIFPSKCLHTAWVATVPTVYGIETL